MKGMPKTTIPFDGFVGDDRPVLTVRIVPTRRWRARMWLAQRLIALAAWVLGMGFRVAEMEDLPDDEE